MLNDITQAFGRYQSRLKGWWQNGKDRTLIKYFRSQIYLDKIIPALMVLGWFGYIPYFFTGLVIVGVPLVVARRHTILGRFKGLLEAVQEGIVDFKTRMNLFVHSLRQRPSQAAPRLIAQYSRQHENAPHPDSPQALMKENTKERLRNWATEKGKDFYKNWVFHILPVYLFFSFALMPAFFAIYGYYRLGPENFINKVKELGQKIFKRIQYRMRWSSPRRGETDAERAIREAQASRKRLILMGFLGIGVAALFSFGFGGIFVGLFNLAFGTILFVAPIYGGYLFIKDCFKAIKRPLEFGTLHTGVYLGAMWGRAWANAVFFGVLTGQVTRMFGQVSTTSVLTMATSALTQTVPEGLKFFGFRPGGAASSILDAMSSHHVVMGADFSGYAGPTNDALFMFMVMGSFYGWITHQISKIIYNEVKEELASIYREAEEGRFRMPQMNNLLYQHRWSLAWASTVLLYTFASPLTPALMSIAGSSSLIALPVVAFLAASIAVGKRYGTRLEAAANRVGTALSDFFNADPTSMVQRYVDRTLEQQQEARRVAEEALHQNPPGMHFDFSVRREDDQFDTGIGVGLDDYSEGEDDRPNVGASFNFNRI